MSRATKIALLDYGMGNLHSASKALSAVGAEVSITNDPKVVAAADKIFFPGVGAMRDCIAGMQEAGIDEVIRQAIFNKPVMAICVGMQALFEQSAENGGTPCLSILDGTVPAFDPAWKDEKGAQIKVPHMGWNKLSLRSSSPLLQEAGDEYVYFVHSFHVEPQQQELITAVCDYGMEVTAAVGSGSVQAFQFHPEKSSRAGLGLLRAFKEWQP